MQHNILVTVIIPVYNTAPYIRECLESVLVQTYRNLEIILINDGSTDTSAEICRCYTADPRVRFIDRENMGLSRTRQEGIDLANGEYFCNLDSDDCLEPSFVEKMLSKIVGCEADIVTCGRHDFDDGYDQDFLLPDGPEEYVLTKQLVSSDFDTLNKNLWLADSWNKMYRTEFVRKNGVRYFLPNQFNGTDLSFNHLLTLHLPKIAVLNEPLLLHRIVIGSRVHRKNKPLQEGFEIITESVLKEADQLGYGEDFCIGYCRIYAKFLQMVFAPILMESETLKEFKSRLTDYYGRRVIFEQKHPLIQPQKLIAEGEHWKARLQNRCIFGKKIGWSIVLFYRNRRKTVRTSENERHI